MAFSASGTPRLPRSTPIAPTAEEWRAMSPQARERLLVEVLDALSDPLSLMSEGRPHKKAKGQAIDMLGLHFAATGRVIYLAEEMAVLYPGKEVFSPDVLAVLGVPQPEDDPRMAWVVAEEGKGLDLVLEVLHHGDRKKDLVDNVERYAQLGIPEYFVYDRLHQRIHGYRLPDPGATQYQRIVPQFGRYGSAVLGLDLAVMENRLRFFYGMAELFGSADFITRLQGMVENLETRADQAQARIDQAQAQAAQAQAQAAQAQARSDQAQTRSDQAQAQAAQAMVALREAILAMLGTRQIPCPDEARTRLLSCDDPATLQRWLMRAMTASSPEELFAR